LKSAHFPPAHPPLKGRPPPWKMEPQTGGGPARWVDFNHPAWLAPRPYKRSRHCGHRDEVPARSPRAFPHFNLKYQDRASHVVRWRIPPICAPNAGIIFSAGTSVAIEKLSGVWPCHSPNLQRLHFPTWWPFSFPPTRPASCGLPKKGE
jgi:hypothetical protein